MNMNSIHYFADGTFCERDWVGFNGYCYQFNTEPGDFEAQEEICAEKDAHLASIQDEHHPYVERWTTDFLTKVYPSE